MAENLEDVVATLKDMGEAAIETPTPESPPADVNSQESQEAGVAQAEGEVVVTPEPSVPAEQPQITYEQALEQIAQARPDLLSQHIEEAAKQLIQYQQQNQLSVEDQEKEEEELNALQFENPAEYRKRFEAKTIRTIMAEVQGKETVIQAIRAQVMTHVPELPAANVDALIQEARSGNYSMSQLRDALNSGSVVTVAESQALKLHRQGAIKPAVTPKVPPTVQKGAPTNSTQGTADKFDAASSAKIKAIAAGLGVTQEEYESTLMQQRKRA